MRNLLLFVAVFVLSSCGVLEKLKGSSQNKTLSPIVYLNNAPKYDVKKFLNGDLEGFAIVRNEKDEIIDSFTAKVDGFWEENRGTIKYSFKFNNGKKDARTWLITVERSGDYEAVGHDFAAPAKGRQSGNVSEIIYSLKKEYRGRKEKIDHDDKIYLVDKNSAIVISEMRIGKKMIGRVTLSLKKLKKKVEVEKVEEKSEASASN